jgi:diguanylate cyclase (GGDEF)-like protein/PAS domain S-box-containing protein
MRELPILLVGNIETQMIFYIIYSILLTGLLFAFAIRHYLSRRDRKLYLQREVSEAIIDNAKTMVLIFSMDEKVLLFNKFAQEMTGYSRKDVVGRSIDETPFPDKGTELGKLIREVLSEKTIVQNKEVCFTTKNGRKVHSLWNIDMISDTENVPVYVAAMGIDITDRKNTESRLADSYQELESLYRELVTKEIELRLQFDDLNARDNDLRRSEERYRLAVEGVNDGVWDWDGKDGRLFMSKKGRAILGIDTDEEFLTIEKWFDVILREDLDKFVISLNKYITEPQNKHFQIEYRIKTADDEIRWIRTRGMAIWDEDGNPIRVAGSITDITEQKLADEKIHRLAFFDSLTGLPNRALLMDRFSVAEANARRKGKSIAVYFLDLDNFKTINDTLGHTYGDKLLLKVGEQLRLKLRKSDTIARLGGDEFIMLQTNINSVDEVYKLAARMLNVFKRPWKLDDREFYVTASIGISIYPNDGTDLRELMKNADAAMYRAKEKGKNNFQIFTPELNMKIMERMEIENHLRKAAERKEFVLYYQPQIELATGKVRSVEALIRWSDPHMGWIMPEAFIHIAEETGLIGNIGEWVMTTACTQLRKWHDEGYHDLKVSVNLSAKQFQQPDIFEKLMDTVEKTGIKPEWLELEITESLAMQDLEHTTGILNRIRDAGFGISLDDFGKGYSSLNYLKALPITNLKIDKTFIHGIAHSSNQAKIVKALISLAHSMDLTVTAEGVERSTQLSFLVKERCDTAQGYLFSKPKPAKDVDLSSYLACVENCMGMGS